MTAFQLLATANLTPEQANSAAASQERRRLRDRLNRTFAHYPDRNRVNNRSVFEADQAVGAATARRAPNVSKHLLVSDERLARQAIADAERALVVVEERNHSVDEAAIQEQLRKARRAVAQGDRVRTVSPVPMGAFAHYRRAWTHAQHALDLLDRAVDPTVRLASRRDPRHNGTLNYTVRGRVFDVRPHALELSVRVDGDPRTSRLLANATPATVGRFALTVELDVQVNEITVVATDRGEPVSRLPDPWTPQSDSTNLRLDGDGLPDTYEETVTTTNPLDPDSDANATTANESGDGVRDGAADLEPDGLPTAEERQLGTDPLANDTDSDNLTDGFEVFVTETDPLAVDSDSDGTPDGAADPDGDGLSNAREEAAGSNPTIADTDADRLNDSAELAVGTDPVVADTDGDGLVDGDEPTEPFETDPLQADTDGDGVLDGNETFTTRTGNASVGAAVSLTGEGNVAAGVRVENQSSSALRTAGVEDARASDVVEFEAARDFESATVSLAYNASRVSNASDLAVYTFDETLGTWVPLDSEVDARNATVTAETPHFSTFAVFSRSEWQDSFEPIPSKWRLDQNFDTGLGAWDCAGDCAVETSQAVVESVAPAPPEDDPTCPNEDPGEDDQDGEDGDTDDGSRDDDGPVRTTANATTSTTCPPDDGDDSGDSGDDTGDGSDGDDTTDDPDGGETPDDGTGDEDGTGDGDDGSDDSDDDTGDGTGGGRLESTANETDGGASTTTCPPDDGEDDTDGDDDGSPGTGGPETESSAIDPDGDLSTADSCPDGDGDSSTSSVLSRTLSGLPAAAETVRVVVRARIDESGETASGEVVVTTPGGRRTLVETTDSFKTVELDVAGITESSLTIRASAEDGATVELDFVRVLVDTDGDGLADPIEETDCIPTAGGECVETDSTVPDTDGDTLSDGREVRTRVETFVGGEPRTYYRLLSRPDTPHSDRDGINDSVEVRGWEVPVETVRVDGEQRPLRWAPDDPDTTVTFTSDPLTESTDDDGVSDGVEKRVLHTDPSANVTYELTRRHQREIVDRFAAKWTREARRIDGDPASVTQAATALGLLTGDDTAGRLKHVRLDDASDDFDFVRVDNGELAFRALNREQRTDTWLSNEGEHRLSRFLDGKIDPWDPDSDDDGLTDGQEAKWVTAVSGTGLTAITKDPTVSYNTLPTKADTDGDGYWDGWLGVYNASDSRNVVLYMEHLVDEDPGVAGDEIVAAQTGVHRVRKTSWEPDRQLVSASTSADIDNDGWTEHSNVHIGELHWAMDPSQSSDPTDGEITPDPSLTVEVDYHANTTRTPREVLSSVSDTYALYDLEIRFQTDDELTHSQLESVVASTGKPVQLDLRPPVTLTKAQEIEDEFHDDRSSLYVFIAPDGAENPQPILLDWAPDVEGVASSQGFDGVIEGVGEGLGFGVVVFTNDHNATITGNDEGPRKTHLMKTTVHEVGHIIGAGRLDDDDQLVVLPEEVYSGSDGSGGDETPEEVGYSGLDSDLWSVMSSGWNDPVNNQPMNGNYVAFSLEELATIEFNNLDTVEGEDE